MSSFQGLIGMVIDAIYFLFFCLAILYNKLSQNSSKTKENINRMKRDEKRERALAGNRTRVNCLEGSYANHYTTNAALFMMVII